MWVYHDKTVSQEILDQIIDSKCKLILMNPSIGFSGSFWRFLPWNDPAIDRWISRDADSLMGIREKNAVDQWVDSGKPVHIMRDHCFHKKSVMAGMFGISNNLYHKHIGIPPKVELEIIGNHEQMIYGDDEKFLDKVLGSLARGGTHCLIHDSRKDKAQEALDFPVKGHGHVGERVFH